MGRIRPMSRISPILSGMFLATEFQASLLRGAQPPQIDRLSELAKVLVIRHVMMLIVLRSLPPLRVARFGRMAWRPAKAPLAAIR